MRVREPLAVLFACAALALAAESWTRARADELLWSCAGQMKGRAILLELHQTDHAEYPLGLDEIRSEWQFAPCPAGGAFRYESTGADYTLVCSGHHDATAPGWPRYTSASGPEYRAP